MFVRSFHTRNALAKIFYRAHFARDSFHVSVVPEIFNNNALNTSQVN